MKSQTETSGAVLVVGAGIAGMQSALDLANAGFKVYLVEEGSSIGGVMPQLDKTFPTNDCAMCILAPKLVDTGRHPNIRILCNAEVEKIEGEVGNFEVKVIRHATCVDPDKCNGCGDCVEQCPVSLPSDFDERIGRRKAISRSFPQAIPNVFGISKEDGIAPCRIGCPAETDVQAYVALASQEKWVESLQVIRQRIPFPGTLGRICHHPCETKCNRKDIEEAVSICQIKRFVADYVYAHPELEAEYAKLIAERLRKNNEEHAAYRDPFARDTSRGQGHKVAIVGAGPSGITAAKDLKKLGYDVSIFEAEAKAGGMMQWTIPAYRLDKKYLDNEIKLALDEDALSITYGKKLGSDFTVADLQKQGFESVFLGLGAQLSRKLPIEGSDAEGVLLGVDFLRQVSKTELKKGDFKGDKVIVIGGGNVAVDVARTSVRLGAAEVHMVCLEDEEIMPAHKWEVEEAREEGIAVHTSLGPDAILTEAGRVSGIRFKKCVSVFDAEGKFNPAFDPACVMALEGTKIIVAIGQVADTAFLEQEGVKLTRGGWIIADKLTLQTSLPYVFAGGDVARGPASVVEAIDAGHEAAISIDRFVHQEDLKAGREDTREAAETPKRERYEKKARVKQTYAPVAARATTFAEVELTLAKEQIVAEAERCLNCGGCSECMQCVANCGRGAIDHHLQDQTFDFRVGSVILSPGYEKFMPETGGSLGYNVYPNVLTSIQFERMLSASGPFKGHITRPSDHQVPKKIAWLQCVGSRDVSCNHPYCSSVCCMYATKEAVIAKEHQKGLETHIYYMDQRSFGKNFEQYRNRSEHEYGVVYRRSRVPRVEQDPVTKNLLIRYIQDDGSVGTEEYDLVVLSVGMQPCDSLGTLAETFQVQLNAYGFIETKDYEKTVTTREGVYVAGAAAEPKDIPEAVTEASCAAADAAKNMYTARNSEIVVKQYPAERDISEEEPRVGVFVCHCGTNIGGVVDVPSVVEEIKKLPFVVRAERNLYTCSQDTQENIKKKILELGINRVVVASCTPRTHEELFQDTIREAGLNPYLFELANIRDQCSWVHRELPLEATQKAVDVVSMAVAKAARLQPVKRQQLPLIQRGLVIGGGIAGMQAALAIADQGYAVYLVEKNTELGGSMRESFLGFGSENPQELLKTTIERVTHHDNIHIYLGSEVKEVTGYVGNFTSRITVVDKIEEVQHGIVIVATGAKDYEPTEYLYGKNANVVRQSDLEKSLADKSFGTDHKQVVMIQCVGSRDDKHPYCSRTCCSTAINNALALKEQSPATEVCILYRDVRTYGFKEDTLYKKAREQGIIFVRYEEGKLPEVQEEGGGLKITLTDPVLRRSIELYPDQLVLSTGVVPAHNEIIGQLLKVPLNQDGFFVEAHTKLRPVDFANDGIYLCGTAHSPRFTEEAITQAKAAASRAVTVLSKETLQTKGIVVTVNPRKCVDCEVCVQVCAYDARKFDEEKGYVMVNEVLCQGCGACAAACPNGATQQNGFSKQQIFSMIDTVLEERVGT
jgi:heterodisulfide reductase subunit A-like polyferredoxin